MSFPTVFLVLLAAAGLAVASDWKTGRATFYGEDHSGVNDGFSIHYGSCQFGSLDPEVGTGWDIAAISDKHPDFQGSCGTCYELKCNPMIFKDNYGSTIDKSDGCLDETKSVVVTVVDVCPCHFPKNLYSNKRWCCGDMDHFDISIFAFEKLAPTGEGVVGLKYRQVPCPSYTSFLPKEAENIVVTTAPTSSLSASSSVSRVSRSSTTDSVSTSTGVIELEPLPQKDDEDSPAASSTVSVGSGSVAITSGSLSAASGSVSVSSSSISTSSGSASAGSQIVSAGSVTTSTSSSTSVSLPASPASSKVAIGRPTVAPRVPAPAAVEEAAGKPLTTKVGHLSDAEEESDEEYELVLGEWTYSKPTGSATSSTSQRVSRISSSDTASTNVQAVDLGSSGPSVSTTTRTSTTATPTPTPVAGGSISSSKAVSVAKSESSVKSPGSLSTTGTSTAKTSASILSGRTPGSSVLSSSTTTSRGGSSVKVTSSSSSSGTLIGKTPSSSITAKTPAGSSLLTSKSITGGSSSTIPSLSSTGSTSISLQASPSSITTSRVSRTSSTDTTATKTTSTGVGLGSVPATNSFAILNQGG